MSKRAQSRVPAQRRLDFTKNDSNPLIIGAPGEKRTRLMFRGLVDLHLFDDEPLRLTMGRPYPRKPVMVDYHSSMPTPIVSQKLRDALMPFELNSAQFVPATVNVKGKLFPYWFVNNHNSIACIDLVGFVAVLVVMP